MIPVVLYIACQGDNTQPTQSEKATAQVFTSEKVKFTKERLRPSQHVLCVDTDKNGIDEGLFIHNGQLHTELNSHPIGGGVQDWVRDESSIWIATGFSKESRDAPMSIYRYSKAGLEENWTEMATRNQITDLKTLSTDDCSWPNSLLEPQSMEDGWKTIFNPSWKPIWQCIKDRCLNHLIKSLLVDYTEMNHARMET